MTTNSKAFDPAQFDVDADDALEQMMNALDELAYEAAPASGQIECRDVVRDTRGFWYAVFWSPKTGSFDLDLPCTRDDIAAAYLSHAKA